MNSTATSDAPIFVRGMSRSGGTLVVTLLDAHRDISMAYELYPNLLEVEKDFDVPGFADALERAPSIREGAELSPNERFRVFLLRCARGGMDEKDIVSVFRQLVEEGHHLSDVAGRMRLIEICGDLKRQRFGKAYWGMKCAGSYKDYLQAWPNARFLNVLRDGRDVLASQMCMTRFNRTPEEVADSWLATHQRFERLMKKNKNQGYVIRYEELTHNPESELRNICEFLSLDFDDAMMRHHKLDLTLYQANHISKERILNKIDTSKIGRWRKELTKDQVDAFTSVAGEGLKHFGYT